MFNGAGGTRAAITAASNMHSSLGESNLIARTAATRPQTLLGLDPTLLGLDLWVTSRVLFVSFNPVSSANQCRAQTRTCQDLPSPIRTFVSLIEIHVPMMFIDWCLIDTLFVSEC